MSLEKDKKRTTKKVLPYYTKGGTLRVGEPVRIRGSYKRYDNLLNEKHRGRWYSLLSPVNGSGKFWVPQTKLIRMKYRY